MLKFCAAALLAVVAGCASQGAPFKELEAPPPGHAMLYIYRTQQAPRSMNLAPGVTLNGKEVGSLPLDGYLRVSTPAGPTDVRLVNRPYMWPEGAPLRSVQVNARPGETRFIEFSVDSFRSEFDGRVANRYIGVSMREVDRATAMRSLPGLKDAN